MILSRIALILCSSLCLVSCSPGALVNGSRSIEKGGWGIEQTEQFSAQVSDTLSGFDYYVLVRQGGNYGYQNLILYLKTYFPNNTYTIDTINCPLAERNGKWLGSGLGDILDNKILFKLNQRFHQFGKYNFEIQHAMRLDTVREIYDVGLLIEKSSR
jgi:gliding motility-associated lipoprotein GldH